MIDKKRSRVLSCKLSPKNHNKFSILAEGNGATPSTYLRMLILQFLRQNDKEIVKAVDLAKRKLEQRRIHAIKFRIVKFWKDCASFQLANYISDGKTDYECFKTEVALLLAWYNGLPPPYKKYATKNVEAIKKITKLRFEEQYRKQLNRLIYKA